MKLAFYGRTGPHASPEAGDREYTAQLRRATRLAQAVGGEIVVEFFDRGVACSAPLSRRRQASAMFAELADKQGRRFDGIVVGEATSALSDCRYEDLGPIFQEHDMTLFVPEAGPDAEPDPARPGRRWLRRRAV